MPDAGVQFSVAYDTEARTVDVITSYTAPTTDGLTSFTLSGLPATGTLTLQWITRRKRTTRP